MGFIFSTLIQYSPPYTLAQQHTKQLRDSMVLCKAQSKMRSALQVF